jgi:hypothetical protein
MSPHYSDYGGRSAVRLGRSCFGVDEPGLEPTVSRSGAICPLPGIPTPVDGPLGRLVWRVVDAADYWLTQARAAGLFPLWQSEVDMVVGRGK